MVEIVEAEQSHEVGIERVLLHHLSGDTWDDTHVPVRQLTTVGKEPVGRVAVEDGTVLGVMGAYDYSSMSTMISERVSGIVQPSISSIPDDRATFLAYAYVDQHRRREGIGSSLLNNLLERAQEENNSDGAYTEAWIYDADLDARGHLQSHNFEPFFWPQNYWSKDTVCSYHEIVECDCEGALFRKNL